MHVDTSLKHLEVNPEGFKGYFTQNTEHEMKAILLGLHAQPVVELTEYSDLCCVPQEVEEDKKRAEQEGMALQSRKGKVDDLTITINKSLAVSTSAPTPFYFTC